MAGFGDFFGGMIDSQMPPTLPGMEDKSLLYKLGAALPNMKMGFYRGNMGMATGLGGGNPGDAQLKAMIAGILKKQQGQTDGSAVNAAPESATTNRYVSDMSLPRFGNGQTPMRPSTMPSQPRFGLNASDDERVIANSPFLRQPNPFGGF